MPFCPQCGHENSVGTRFCPACGAPQASSTADTELEQQAVAAPPVTPFSSVRAAPQRSARKIVTAVFTDLVGSTEMGEKLDPETVRTVMSRYFATMSDILQSHGGTVEKFIGDAIVAVFGIPVVHEDDALRAVRAATEMRRAMAEINQELGERWGLELTARTGVNTGEVIAVERADRQAFSTGDAMNVAARLEQASAGGEILIGETTHRLVRHAVVDEEVQPLTLKGKSKPVRAWRLLDVKTGMPAISRRLDSRMIGRQKELTLLMEGFERALAERNCHLVTVYGSAGVGKSRLAAELIKGLEERATVLQGRCLPYGEGITFFALTEAVKYAAGISDGDRPQEARYKVEALIGEDDDCSLIAERLCEAMGLIQGSAGSQEIFWAVRKLFETLARREPLLVVFDDIHWAEPTFLDMLQYLGGWSRDGAIFILCLARKELLDSYPRWASGSPNMTSVDVEPLGEPESERLIEELLGYAELPEEAVARITEASEGNPLYVEEMLKMLIDDGMLARNNGGWSISGELSGITIPPTIQALLAARLDRLREGELAVIQRAAVIGKVFWWGGVVHISPEDARPAVGGHLQTLMRKELVVPERSSFPGEDAFRFGHSLIRDAAYEEVPKMARTELHERFASWLEAKMGERVMEYEEILGYHLEQAFRYHYELGSPGAKRRAIAEQALRWLSSAGHRALVRSDMPAASRLLDRAAALLESGDPRRLELLLDLCDALIEMGDLARAESVLDDLSAVVTAAGDRRVNARFAIGRSVLRFHTGAPEGSREKTMREVERVMRVFEELGDDFGLAQAYQLRAEVHWDERQFGATQKALEQALAHARKANNEREEAKILSWLSSALFWGPEHAEEAIRSCEEILKRAKGNLLVEAKLLSVIGALHGMRGRFHEARNLMARGRALQKDLGHNLSIAAGRQFSGLTELLAGDAAAAEKELRLGYEMLEQIGGKGYLVTTAAFLARALYAQGKYEDAEEFTRISEGMSASDDIMNKADWAGTRAKVLVRRGRLAEAEELAREAADIFDEHEEPNERGNALMDLAEVLSLAGRRKEAIPMVEEAVLRYNLKGVLPSSEKAQALLVELSS